MSRRCRKNIISAVVRLTDWHHALHRVWFQQIDWGIDMRYVWAVGIHHFWWARSAQPLSLTTQKRGEYYRQIACSVCEWICILIVATIRLHSVGRCRQSLCLPNTNSIPKSNKNQLRTLYAHGLSAVAAQIWKEIYRKPHKCNESSYGIHIFRCGFRIRSSIFLFPYVACGNSLLGENKKWKKIVKRTGCTQCTHDFSFFRISKAEATMG